MRRAVVWVPIASSMGFPPPHMWPAGKILTCEDKKCKIAAQQFCLDHMNYELHCAKTYLGHHYPRGIFPATLMMLLSQKKVQVPGLKYHIVYHFPLAKMPKYIILGWAHSDLIEFDWSNLTGLVQLESLGRSLPDEIEMRGTERRKRGLKGVGMRQYWVNFFLLFWNEGKFWYLLYQSLTTSCETFKALIAFFAKILSGVLC